MQKINVITPYNVNNFFTYLAPKNLYLKVGDIVLLQVRSINTFGLVTEIENIFYNKPLKNIINKLDNVQLSAELIQFIIWCSKYNFINLGVLMKMVLPFLDILSKKDNITKETFYLYNYEKSTSNTKLSPKQKNLLKQFQIRNILTEKQVKKLNISKTVLNNLLKHNLITKHIENNVVRYCHQDDININLNIVLNEYQQKAYNHLLSIISEDKFKVALLDGIPGSGKTEVYFKLIADILNKNKAILVLLPEIALSTQWIDRFESNFGVKPYIWHSDVPKKDKKTIFYDILYGRVRVILGTRSSLFLPYKNLGLIIIDEEHDTSFKQEEKVIYNARDMAIIRGYNENIPVVLSTATPSLESWYNAQIGKYHHVSLKTRFNQSSLPNIELINMSYNNTAKDEYISNQLLNALISNLNDKNQSLLFLNKRGYSNINFCKICNNKLICPNCSHNEENIVYLIEHKTKNQLICHRCAYWKKIDRNCNVCGTKDSIVAYGYGIEKIYEELQKKLPNARIALASSDIINSVSRAKELVKNINEQNIDIIIGTQILAKGYHFPNLSLVGILDPGLEQSSIDLKSNERVWQLLYQVAGRAGREKVKGKVILQSHINNFIIQTLVQFKRDEFLQIELNDRKNNNMPPFTKLASIIISAKNEIILQNYIKQLRNAIFNLPKEYQNYISGPIPAVFYKINQRFRYRFLINTQKNFNIQYIVNLFLSKVKIPTQVFVKIDIDPVSFY